MRALSALVTLTLILGACGPNEGVSSPNQSTTSSSVSTTESNEGGFGAPSRALGEFALGPGRAAGGALELPAGGCWYAELNGTSRLAVFPTGFALGPAGGELVDDAGSVFRSGDRFDGVASVMPGSEIPGGVDGKWGNYMAYCQPERDELFVFDSIVPEFDPTSLNQDELIAMLEAAVWTEHYECGRGWATSTADQTVGMVIYEAQPIASASDDRVLLPDPNWIASIRIGKNLFSEHCNDAIEEWVALPTIAVDWPLDAGVITIDDPVPGLDDGAARVRASLEGGRVDTGTRTVDLPKVQLDNQNFNFFAG